MYYQEKKTIATLASGILILVAYCIFGISKYLEIGEKALYDLKLWATVMLITIGGGVVVVIIVQIIFHIIFAIAHEVAKKKVSQKGNGDGNNETFEELDITDFEDEMDKLIVLKAMRNSYVVVGVGFVLALISLYMNMPPAIMINITFLSFLVGSLFEGFSQLYFYRKGVKNG